MQHAIMCQPWATVHLVGGKVVLQHVLLVIHTPHVSGRGLQLSLLGGQLLLQLVDAGRLAAQLLPEGPDLGLWT